MILLERFKSNRICYTVVVRFFASENFVVHRGSQPSLSGLWQKNFPTNGKKVHGSIPIDLCTFRWNCVLLDGTVYLNGAGNGAVYLVRPGR